MKIHIVQKGDTLWKIAQKYGVDFNELKHVNTQLSNPDMIMPGMKIKIPTGSVPVQKHGHPHSKEEVFLSHFAPKEMPLPMPPTQMPPKEMPKPIQPTPAPMPVVPKEIPQQIIPTPVVPKEMPVPPVIKETPIVLPPIPQMPIEQSEIDYNIEQNMFNYTFNIPTFPIKEAPVKEKPVEKVKEKPVVPPTMPALPMPEPPPAYPCVPMTGLMPGSGLPCGFQPMPCPPMLCPPYPCPPVAVPYGMQAPMFNPAGYGAMPAMQGAPYTPQPMAVSPAMFDDDNDGSEQMYPGLSPMSAPIAPVAPVGQMTAAGGDCGCGGPNMDPPAIGSMPAGIGSVPTGYSGMPVAGYGGVPGAGYSGMPAGYGGVPGAGYGGMPVAGYGGVPTAGYGGIPAGVAGVPAGYGSAPVGNMGVPTGFAGMPPTGYGGFRGGYGGMPTGFEMPAGFGAPQTGLAGAGSQAPQGTFAPPEFPFAQFQTQMPTTNFGEPPFRNDVLDDEEDDW